MRSVPVGSVTQYNNYKGDGLGRHAGGSARLSELIGGAMDDKYLTLYLSIRSCRAREDILAIATKKLQHDDREI